MPAASASFARLRHSNAAPGEWKVARRTAPDRRRFRRVPLTIGGRLLDETGRELDCRTEDISPGGARIAAADDAPVLGATIVLYLDGLGRITARVTRKDEMSFSVSFEGSSHKREKLVEQLTLLMNKDIAAGLDEARREIRRPGAGDVTIILEDGSTRLCEVLDFSLVGASLRMRGPAPALGAWVQIGQTFGRVARLLDGGFAVDFRSRG